MEVLKLKKSNCKNCYKCIRYCPVKSIRFSGNQAHIVKEDCILCGQCFVVCPQEAKQIADETEKAKVLIQSGDPVYVSLAPSFIANYSDIGFAGLRTALLKLGFTEVEETAIGATIVKTEYERMLREDDRSILISSCCHSVNLLIRKFFPSCLPYLADILSPMLAHCRDIKRRRPEAKTVFIGPCVSKKDEADTITDYCDAVLTFEELSEWFKKENVTPVWEPDHTEKGKGRLFPTTGGILGTMAKESGRTYIAIDKVENCIAALQDIEDGKLENCFIEMSACYGSCIGGPVMAKYHHSPVRDHIAVTTYASDEDFKVHQPGRGEIHYDMLPMNSSYRNRKPSEAEIAAVLRQMGKYKPSDELNCGFCGYNTCREKAIAIMEGKAEIEMCLPFLKEKAENFSDNIIQNTPNGILVLNENFEVQQINRAAMRLLNVRSASDVMGEQVVRILDPKTFMEVMSTGKSVHDQREYLAEYNKYVEQSVIYDKEYKILICIMRDVTAEENEKAKKESISRKTVETADRVVDNQMRIVQEIASLLGETAAETKIALAKLKEAISDNE